MHNSKQQDNGRAPQRVRNELRFRQVEVIAKQQIAGSFYRIEFGGEALAGFSSRGFDDHIKVFFPDPAGGELHLPEITEQGIVWPEGARPAGRDYTPLAFDAQQNRLTIDFYIHPGGIASDWAARAVPGNTLLFGGPRGSLIVPADYAFQLYVCDETGLPAVKRRLQNMQASTAKLFAFTDEAVGRAYLGELDGVQACWLGSGNMQAANLAGLMAELNQLDVPADDYFIWLTGEGAAVKTLSDYFIEQRKRDAAFVRAVAYWHQK